MVSEIYNTCEMNDQEQDTNDRLLRSMVTRINTYHRKTIKLTPANLAYFAGIFDTEVHFSIDSTHSFHIDYDKSNKDFLKIFSLSFGGEIHKEKPLPERKMDVWHWYVSSDQAYKILKQIYPFLRIRREKARLCIQCYETGKISRLTKVDRAKIWEQYIKLIKDSETRPEKRFDYSTIPDLKIAYLAGMFDVDSSFVISRRTEPGRTSYLLQVIKRKNDYETMEFIAGVFGGKIHTTTKGRLNKQDVWELKYSSQQAYKVLQQIYPYLKAQKRIAEICMEFHERYYKGNTIDEQFNAVSPERKAIGVSSVSLLHAHHLKWRSRYGKQRVEP
jgi:hypothetical protein